MITSIKVNCLLLIYLVSSEQQQKRCQINMIPNSGIPNPTNLNPNLLLGMGILIGIGIQLGYSIGNPFLTSTSRCPSCAFGRL
jgi:hypothetical protein